MRAMLLSAGLVAVLVASLAGKAGNLIQSPPAQTEGQETLLAVLRARGFTIEAVESASNPPWIVATKGNCAMRVATVSPQGWSSDVVAVQADGGRLLYAFDGVFYDDQPVLRTSIAEYRRRLEYYLGLPAGPSVVRALILSPQCPDTTLGAQDAAALSR